MSAGVVLGCSDSYPVLQTICLHPEGVDQVVNVDPRTTKLDVVIRHINRSCLPSDIHTLFCINLR